MNEDIEQQRVDQNEIRTHQILVLTGLLTGFITDRWEWVAIQAAVFLIAFLLPPLNPYVFIYRGVLKAPGVS